MISLGQGEHGYCLPPHPELYTGRDRRLPKWAKMWTRRDVLFSFEERIWKVISDGSHNNTPERGRWHYLTRSERRIGMLVQFVTAIPVDVSEKRLSKEPRSMGRFAENLMRVQRQGRRFTPDLLRRATHIKWWKQ
jgi:hypothetical protein